MSIVVFTAACTAATAPTAVPTAIIDTTPVSPTPEPISDIPVPMCTPPACQTNEVYYCEGDCPGGCGVICATVTSAPGAQLAPAPTDWSALAGWLTTAWIDHIDPAAVRAELQAAGWQEEQAQWLGVDLDGDRRDEWVLVLFDATSAERRDLVFAKEGNLWIVNGSGVIYRHNPQDGAEPPVFAPNIAGTADLTGDGLPELVTEEVTCGAHTCFSDFRILSWRNGRLQNVVQHPEPQDPAIPQTISISFAEPSFSDYTQDGLTDFLVHGGTIGSAGAGIMRAYTEVWSWDGTAVTLTEVLPDWTDYRHHILYEANGRMDAGDLAEALRLYEAAINDDRLISPEFLTTPAETYAAISQFAAFRLILIDLLQGDVQRANGRLAWMQQNYPGAPLTAAAATLLNGWSSADGLPALCATITNMLETYENPTGGLENLGYGNPSLTAVDVCRPPAQP